MTAPHRRPRSVRRAARRGTPGRGAAPRDARPAPLGTSEPAHRPRTARPTPAPPPAPSAGTAPSGGPAPAAHTARDAGTAPAARTTPGLRALITAGSVVGLDDSAAVCALVVELVATGPALVGTSSLDTMSALTATTPARTGAMQVRLFGGVHQAGAFGGARSLHAVTATRCDVALVGGRVVGADVWVPVAAREVRTGLLLAAERTYLVSERPDDEPLPDDVTWARLAALTDFDGRLPPVPATDDAAENATAA